MKYKLLFIALLFSLSFLVDKWLILFIINHRIEDFNIFFGYVSTYFNTVIIISLSTLLILIKERKKLFALISSFSVLGILTLIIKFIIKRTRPFIALSLDKINNINYNLISLNSSFPSWHAIVVFSILPFVSKDYKIFWILIAILISFSRIYIGVHYLSDVLFGALIGYIIGYLAKEYLVD